VSGDAAALASEAGQSAAGLQEKIAGTLHAAALDEETAEEYVATFNRAVVKRLPRFALEIENR
jgi:hypothetical protein